MIYVIGNKDLDICKIGFSDNPYERIRSLSSTVLFEIEIFKIIEGNRRMERNIHNKFAKYRIKGEWFILSKIDLTDLSANFEYINFLSGKIIKNEQYYFLPDIIEVINSNKFPFGKAYFDSANYFYTEESKMFIDSLNEYCVPIIDNGFGRWIHEFLFIEICRAAGPEEKLAAYNFFFSGIL